MAASLFATKRPLMVRASSSKNSNPYMAMNKTAHPTGPQAPDMIAPGLFLTDLFTARQTLLPTYPSSHRPPIKYVLSLLDNSLSQPHPKPDSRKDQFSQKLVLIDDVPDADILVHFKPLCDWISTSISNADGGVLVHCHMGQSRSAAIVIAYVMRQDNIDVDRAIERVKRRRPVVRPNEGFVKQLRLWREMEFDVWEEVDVEVDEEVDVIGADGQKTGERRVEKAMRKVRRRKEGYEAWKKEQEKRTKRYLDNLV